MIKMTRICLITEGTYPIAIGGVSKWTHTLISNMPDVEFDVVSLVPDDRITYNYNLPPNVKSIRVWPVWEDSNCDACGCSIEANKEDSTRKIKQYFKSEAAKFKESQYLNDGFIKPLNRLFDMPIPEADLYHAVNAGYAGLIAGLAKKLYSKPVIVTEHGSYYKEWFLRLSSVDFPDELKHPKILKPEDHTQIMLLKFIKKLVNFSFHSADIIAPVTGAHVPLELNLGADPRKIKVIPNGVNYNKFTCRVGDNDQSKDPIVGTVARVNPIKDVKTMIRAAKVVADEMPNVKFEYVGPKEDLEYSNESQALIEELNISHNFKFIPETFFPEEVYSRFQVFVLSSISEAQPLAILEAMSSGVPVVATRVGGVPEPVSGNGLLVNPGDYTELAKSILFYLKNPVKKENAGKLSREKIIKHYSEQSFINSYKATYSSLL